MSALDTDARVALLDQRVTAIESEVRSDLKELRDDVKALREELRGRPSWPVTVYLTICTSALVGLMTFLVANPS